MWITKKEAMAALNVNIKELFKLILKYSIRTKKQGNCLLINNKDLLNLI
jgi:hypothetical protein